MRKKVSIDIDDCYGYLNQIRPYLDTPNIMASMLMKEFGFDASLANQMLKDWAKYTEARMDHPWDKERFQRWWAKLEKKSEGGIENDFVDEISQGVVVVNNEPIYTLDYVRKLQAEINVLRSALNAALENVKKSST